MQPFTGQKKNSSRTSYFRKRIFSGFGMIPSDVSTLSKKQSKQRTGPPDQVDSVVNIARLPPAHITEGEFINNKLMAATLSAVLTKFDLPDAHHAKIMEAFRGVALVYMPEKMAWDVSTRFVINTVTIQSTISVWEDILTESGPETQWMTIALAIANIDKTIVAKLLLMC